MAKSQSNQLYKVSHDLRSITKWISFDQEVTLLKAADSAVLFVQDEYADFYLIRVKDLIKDEYTISRIELDG